MSRFRITKNLLSGVSGAGAGSAVPVQSAENLPTRRYDMNAVAKSSTTGAPTGCICAVEGSFDGSTWFTLAVQDIIVEGANFAIPNSPVKYLRGNLISFTGGTTPTATLTVDMEQ